MMSEEKKPEAKEGEAESEVVNVNGGILKDLQVKELEEKTELSPVGILDILISNTDSDTGVADDGCNCNSQCGGNCKGNC
jgi:hypothetical protein